MSAGRYLDAARHARPSQLAGRLRRLVPPGVLALGTEGRPPGLRPVLAGLAVDPAPQSGPVEPPETSGVFRAVGATRRRDVPGFWSDPSDGLLFLFQLHGFSPLAAYAAGSTTPEGDAFWVGMVDSWLRAHARPAHPAWHPFPLSVRLAAWAAALSSPIAWPGDVRARALRSLWRQARYLRRAVEHDIGGNHVLKNATALVFAGAVCGSDATLDAGLRLLRRQVSRQILADGGHEERSTSYHRAVAHELAETATVLERLGRPVPAWLAGAQAATRRWQGTMAGPDGRLPLLNDAWEGPPVAGAAAGPVTHLEASGLVVVRHGGDQATFDVGPISPPHLPPHAHADVLSFVLWGDGRPAVVDPGTFAYTGPWRDELRGTRAHSTVEVDGRDQCEFWGDFRAAFHPRVTAAAPRSEDGVIVVAAWHDGYRRLADPVLHHRTFLWLPGEGLAVVDRLACRCPHAIRARLPLAPGRSDAAPFAVAALGGAAHEPARVPAVYSPYLGSRTPSEALEVARTVAPGEAFGWSLLRSGRVDRLDGEAIELAGRRVALPRLPA